MLEAVLRRRGYTTLHAPDGRAAVTLAEERRFDLILMVRAGWGLGSAWVGFLTRPEWTGGCLLGSGELPPDADGAHEADGAEIGNLMLDTRTHARVQLGTAQIVRPWRE